VTDNSRANRIAELFAQLAELVAADQSPKIPAPRRPSDQTMTVAEFCAELGIARSTFNDWRAKGSGPRCIKLPNGEIRIRRVEFERWLNAREGTN
jgi:predicted DNA-binding transcriptional regulator AlpA